MVVGHLVVRSLPTQEVRGSNPVFCQICIEQLFPVICIEKTKLRKKRLGMAHLLKNYIWRGAYSIANTAGDKFI